MDHGCGSFTRRNRILTRRTEKTPDVSVRESCRLLLAAINGQTEAEPHVQQLAKLRTKNQFLAKPQPRLND